MKFDLILSNPPFQDVQERGKTRHKLWIDFTLKSLNEWLKPGGTLCQVSPGSFRSPSSRVLKAMKRLQTNWIDFDVRDNFPGIGSTFATYSITNVPQAAATELYAEHSSIPIILSEHIPYLPLDAPEGISIHQKVMWGPGAKLRVEWDYVTAHNIKRNTTKSLSEVRTPQHAFPVFHTNNKTWWSSIKPIYLNELKVMWTRSGYFRPFFDNGTLGVTDMAYFVKVRDIEAGNNLVYNLNSKLMRYIVQSTQWSGFTHELVFRMMPGLPTERALTDKELYAQFGLEKAEVLHLEKYLG